MKTEKIKTNTKLEEYVKNYLLKNYDNREQRKQFIHDLLKHGTKSGIVSELIYYVDTINFYDKFANDIENLLYEYQQMMMFENRFQTIHLGLNDTEHINSIEEEKDLLARFGFEITAEKIGNKMNLEL